MRRRNSACMLTLALIGIGLPAIARTAPAQTVPDPTGLVVVAHPAVTAEAVSPAMLQSIYLGRTTAWGDGTPTRPAMPESGPVLNAFLKAYVKKAPSHFGLYWKKAIFTGTGTPPESFKDDAALIAYVTSTPGAVGFVKAGSDVGKAKVLAVH